MDSMSAWKKFESTGNIKYYLDYRLQESMQNGLMPYSEFYDSNSNASGVNKNEFESNRDNYKRK